MLLCSNFITFSQYLITNPCCVFWSCRGGYQESDTDDTDDTRDNERLERKALSQPVYTVAPSKLGEIQLAAAQEHELAWQSEGNQWIGLRIRRQFNESGGNVDGTITGWLPPGGENMKVSVL
jgi:hypothetical protein